MLKSLLAALAAVLSLVWIAPDDAAAQSRGARTKKAKAQTVRVTRQSASVGQNGLCQRDTGTPSSNLNFRNPCDTEEFWRRIMDRGGSSDR